MTNNIATRDEMKAVDRWENEGGRVSPLNSNLDRVSTGSGSDPVSDQKYFDDTQD